MYQKKSKEIKLSSSSFLHEKDDKLQSQLDQLLELQVENKKVLTEYMERRDLKRHDWHDWVCTYLY